MSALRNLTLEEALSVVREAIEAGKVLLLVARCEVLYHGRASSRLTEGDRVIILKPDGSLVVHRPKGFEPVNWQPPGAVAGASIEGGHLVLRVARRRPSELVVLRISKVYLAAALKLEDAGTFEMYGSEEELRDAIAANPSVLEEGLKLVEVERKVRPGFADVLCIDGKGRLVVIEVKRTTAGAEAVIQLKRYVEALRRELGREVRGVLAAPKLSRGAAAMLAKEGLEFKRIDPKKLLREFKRPPGYAPLF